MNIYERLISILVEQRLDESNRSEAEAEKQVKPGEGRKSTIAKVKGRQHRYDAPGTFKQDVVRMSGGEDKDGKPAPVSRKEAHRRARGKPTKGAKDKPVKVTNPQLKSKMATMMLKMRKPQIP